MLLYIGGLLIALGVGFLTGLFGVGGGFMMTPALMIFLNVPGADGQPVQRVGRNRRRQRPSTARSPTHRPGPAVGRCHPCVVVPHGPGRLVCKEAHEWQDRRWPCPFHRGLCGLLPAHGSGQDPSDHQFNHDRRCHRRTPDL